MCRKRSKYFGSSSISCLTFVLRIITLMAMQLTSNPIAQHSFSAFPAYANKVSSASGFHGNIDNFYTCLGLCLLHAGCNVVFYDNTTRYCSGTNDTDVETFVDSLVVRVGVNAYRLASECDSSGYILNRQTGQCLKFVLEKKNWSDARQYCEDDRGSLLKIDNMTRFWGAIHMSYIYFRTHNDFYVGASDIASEGVWTWLDGTAVEGITTKFNNVDMQFNPSSPANCGLLAPFYTVVADNRCSGINYFICERREMESL